MAERRDSWITISGLDSIKLCQSWTHSNYLPSWWQMLHHKKSEIAIFIDKFKIFFKVISIGEKNCIYPKNNKVHYLWQFLQLSLMLCLRLGSGFVVPDTKQFYPEQGHKPILVPRGCSKGHIRPKTWFNIYSISKNYLCNFQIRLSALFSNIVWIWLVTMDDLNRLKTYYTSKSYYSQFWVYFIY